MARSLEAFLFFYYLKNIPDEVASTLIKGKLMGNIRVLKEREG